MVTETAIWWQVDYAYWAAGGRRIATFMQVQAEDEASALARAKQLGRSTASWQGATVRRMA